ncbi:Hsp20/alpha crystallin family protein, partial [Singulisphaera rosea]
MSRGRELLRREAGLISADWSPRVDILEGGHALVIRVDLPGLCREDIEVEIADDTLTIAGERNVETKEASKGRCYIECPHGRFRRPIPL